jgi:hypothetical protein
VEEAPENGKELSNSAHANGMNEYEKTGSFYVLLSLYFLFVS